jgi:hypothetical protein
MAPIKRPNISVFSVVTGYGVAEDFLQGQEFFLSPEFPAGIESHSASYSVGKGGLS